MPEQKVNSVKEIYPRYTPIIFVIQAIAYLISIFVFFLAPLYATWNEESWGHGWDGSQRRSNEMNWRLSQIGGAAKAFLIISFILVTSYLLILFILEIKWYRNREKITSKKLAWLIVFAVIVGFFVLLTLTLSTYGISSNSYSADTGCYGNAGCSYYGKGSKSALRGAGWLIFLWALAVTGHLVPFSFAYQNSKQ